MGERFNGFRLPASIEKGIFGLAVKSQVGCATICRHPGVTNRRVVVAAGVAILLSACAAILKPADMSAVVAGRALARWEALIAGDLGTAYSYLSPGTRQTVSLDRYKGRIKPGLWRKAEVKGVECKDSACIVQLVITYDYKIMGRQVGGLTTDLVETWLVENGDAWYVLEK
jgi:hypothetical protein